MGGKVHFNDEVETCETYPSGDYDRTSVTIAELTKDELYEIVCYRLEMKKQTIEEYQKRMKTKTLLHKRNQPSSNNNNNSILDSSSLFLRNNNKHLKKNSSTKKNSYSLVSNSHIPNMEGKSSTEKFYPRPGTKLIKSFHPWMI